PGLLPGGRPVEDDAARAQVAQAWGAELPAEPGRDTAGILAALASGALGGALVGGVELTDLPHPAVARAALDPAEFVVSFWVRASVVSVRADGVRPGAWPVGRAGSYGNWEGRVRSFGGALESNALPEHRVLHVLAQQLGTDLQAGTTAEAH